MRPGRRVHRGAGEARDPDRGAGGVAIPAIIVQTFIAATPPRIWEALQRRTDILFDGLPAKQWSTGVEQAPFHLQAMWPYTESAGGATEVRIALHPLGGGARLDLRHEGWGEGPEWEEALGGHFAGWLQGLAALGLLVETGVDARAQNRALKGRERYFISGEIPADTAAAYRALTDAAVLARWAGGAFDGMTALETVENRFIRWSTPGAGELTAILRPTPRGTHVAIAEYGVTDRGASGRWPGMFEKLAKFLG